MSRKGAWDRGSGSVHPQGEKSMAESRLSCGKALVGTGRAISVLWHKGHRNKLPCLHFPAVYQL